MFFFFIIGFGKRTVEPLGSAGVRVCPNCGNRAEWGTVKEKSWVTLFFVPIFPYRTEIVSVCPICQYAVEAG